MNCGLRFTASRMRAPAHTRAKGQAADLRDSVLTFYLPQDKIHFGGVAAVLSSQPVPVLN